MKFIKKGAAFAEAWKSEGWRNLVDTFRNGEIKYTISFTHIQWVFSVLKLKSPE